MKILHAADIHVCEKHHRWIDIALTNLVKQAREQKIDAWVIAGDSFDSAIAAHTPAYAMFVRHVMALADIAPGILLYGTPSHDRPGVLEPFKHMRTRYPIHVADKPERIHLLDEVWKWQADDVPVKDWDDIAATFCLMPSLNKADPEIMEHGAREVMQKWFDLWAEKNRNSDCHTFLVTHGTVNGSRTESGYAMVSTDWEFSTETLYSSGAKYVLLGHLHPHQFWYGASFAYGDHCVAYPGSLARLVYGDLNDKGFLIWDTEKLKPPFDFIKSPTRTLIEVTFDGTPDMEDLQEIASSADADTHVRILWEVDQPDVHTVDQEAIRAMFAHAEGIKLCGTVTKMQSVRSAGISKALTIEEKVAAYLETTGDESEMPVLSQRLSQLQSEEIDRIIERLSRI